MTEKESTMNDERKHSDDEPLDWGKEINRGYLYRGEYETFFAGQRIAAIIFITVLLIGLVLGLLTQ